MLTYNYFTPLRYPGGKGQLSNFFKLLLLNNQLADAPYAEVYAGGAGVAISLLLEHYVSQIYINDVSKSIIAFWTSVINHTDELCRLIHNSPMTIEYWRIQKQIQKNPENYSTIDLGFSTFYLNRTNRSGIILGGLIGGKSQSGKWKMDARYNKIDLIKRIQQIAIYRSRINLYCLDAEKFIKEILKTLPEYSLVYLDPPYYKKGADLYEHHYKSEDHFKIAELVKSDIKQRWVVSYDNTIEIRRLYRPLKNIRYNLSYSAQDRYKGNEVMYFDSRLKVPRVNNPAFVYL